MLMASTASTNGCARRDLFPTQLRLLGIEPGRSKREAELHRHFAKERANGEWYEQSSRLLRYIADYTMRCPEAYIGATVRTNHAMVLAILASAVYHGRAFNEEINHLLKLGLAAAS